MTIVWTKWCGRCRTCHPPEAFYPSDLRRPSGWCKGCRVEWQRLRYRAERGIDPSAPDQRRRSGDQHPRWRGDDASYGAAHDHLRTTRGPATAHECCGCGGPASQWAYDYSDPAPLRDGRGLLYSRDVARYRPMCPSCHKLHDIAHAEGVSA
jgi:hypothetical protein